MDEARAVLARLERIEALERGGAAPGAVLSELRELVQEAEAWARRECDPRADEAVARLTRASKMMFVTTEIGENDRAGPGVIAGPSLSITFSEHRRERSRLG